MQQQHAPATQWRRLTGKCPLSTLLALHPQTLSLDTHPPSLMPFHTCKRPVLPLLGQLESPFHVQPDLTIIVHDPRASDVGTRTGEHA